MGGTSNSLHDVTVGSSSLDIGKKTYNWVVGCGDRWRGEETSGQRSAAPQEVAAFDRVLSLLVQ